MKIKELGKLFKEFIIKIFGEAIYKILCEVVLPVLLKVVLPGIVTVLTALVAKPLAEKYFPFWEKVPGIIKVLIIIVPIIILVVGFISAVWIFSRAWRIYKVYKNSGIRDYRPYKKAEDKEKNEKFLLEQVEKAKNIKIIGATGHQTFSRSDTAGKAVLRDILERISGEITILLLDPRANQTKSRAQSLKEPEVSLEQYQQDIKSSIEFLKYLKQKKSKSVTLKLYSQRPIWKMIIADDNFLWLQYYDPEKHVEHTPVYGIRCRDEYTLFEPLRDVFLKKWWHDDNPSYNFETDELEYPNGKREKLSL